MSNGHREAKFGFVSFYSKIIFVFSEFIIAFFCPTSWVILKQLDPSPSRAMDQQPIEPERVRV